MRRVAASTLVLLGLLAASIAWWALAARFTVLDSDRSARIADTLIEQPVIRDAVAEGLATALRQALPPGTPIDEVQLDEIAHKALDDPRALAALRGAVVASHQRLIGEYDGPVTVDVTPIAAAGRDALLAARPELAKKLPKAPQLSVDLPTQKLPKLGWLPERAREIGGLASILAVACLALGLLAAADRPKVLSRGGRWALRAGIGWFAFGWAIPYVMTKIQEPRLAALGAIGIATVGPMIGPATFMTCLGIGALLGARAWRTALAALPPAPPTGGPTFPPRGPAVPDPVPATRPDPYGRPRQPVGTSSSRTWRM